MSFRLPSRRLHRLSCLHRLFLVPSRLPSRPRCPLGLVVLGCRWRSRPPLPVPGGLSAGHFQGLPSCCLAGKGTLAVGKYTTKSVYKKKKTLNLFNFLRKRGKKRAEKGKKGEGTGWEWRKSRKKRGGGEKEGDGKGKGGGRCGTVFCTSRQRAWSCRGVGAVEYESVEYEEDEFPEQLSY